MRMEHSENFKAVLEEKTRETESIIVAYLPKEEGFAKELAKAMNAKGYQFSSANSINIGRLVPQVVYYVYSYTRLLAQGVVKEGEQVNFVVPTGNFGNILAAFYAKNMGVPVGKLICASNDNKVLYDFFETGVYDKNREFILTTSPSLIDAVYSHVSPLRRITILPFGFDKSKS